MLTRSGRLRRAGRQRQPHARQAAARLDALRRRLHDAVQPAFQQHQMAADLQLGHQLAGAGLRRPGFAGRMARVWLWRAWSSSRQRSGRGRIGRALRTSLILAGWRRRRGECWLLVLTRLHYAFPNRKRGQRQKCVVDARGRQSQRQQPAPPGGADALGGRAEVECHRRQTRPPDLAQRQAPGLRPDAREEAQRSLLRADQRLGLVRLERPGDVTRPVSNSRASSTVCPTTTKRRSRSREAASRAQASSTS